MAPETPDEPPGSAEPPAWLREAAMADLDHLLEIEQRCFPGDRLSRRAFRHLLTRANAIHLVAGVGRTAVGYVSVLLRAGSRGARIYSLAVDPRWQGRRIGKQLLEGAEARASAAGCERIRLEVRADNQRAIRQYRQAGYEQIGAKPGYYEDGEAALRFEKRLAPTDGTGPH